MWLELSAMVPGLEWSVVLTYARVQAFVLALPAIGERTIPLRVRISLALALSPLLTGYAAPVRPPDTAIALTADIAAETVIGLACGWLLRLLAMAIDLATSAIAATASLSQIVGAPNEYSPHPIGNLLHLGGIAILMALGLPVMLVQLIADSLLLWPPGGVPLATDFAPEAVRILSFSFMLAMLLAAPFSLGGFLYQALSGVINRVMPSLPVIFIGSPAAIMLALIGLAILSPMILSLWADAILSFTLPRTP